MFSRRLVITAGCVTALTALIAGGCNSDLATTADRPAAVSQKLAPRPQHEITYDRHSLIVDGRPVFLQSAEFHYFRLPSPGLWRDVLEKLRAGGFNAISVYFNWAYHSPAPGVYDFTGVRDVDRFLGMAEAAGLYVIARPGPYINAETTGGGLPAWLKLVPGRARSSDPGYTAAYRDWLAHINPILARHQITRGGSVILYNVENEYAVNTDAAYMQDLQDQAAAAGITVPITHNDCCDAASWTSTWATGPGAVELPGVDDYPQSFDCAHPDIWGPWGEGVTERLRDDTPGLALEYQAGAIDQFNAGYDQCRLLTGPSYMKFFFKSNLIRSGATLASYYMGFGGTNWGWLAQPNDVQTSYDYGAAITEARQLTAKYDEFKRQGSFVAAVAPLARTDAASACSSDNPAIEALTRQNPDTGTVFVLARHADRAATSDDAATLACTTPDGELAVPVRVIGRDAKLLVAGYDLGGQRLLWSSSELMTHLAIPSMGDDPHLAIPDLGLGLGGDDPHHSAGATDVALVYGTAGTAGATVLGYASRPRVTVLDGAATTAFDAGRGALRLDYSHAGLSRIRVTGGGRRPLLLLVATDEAAAAFWRLDTAAGPVLVRGGSLVRSAELARGAIRLRADSDAPGDIEVFAPASRLIVNGDAVAVRTTASGSIAGRLPGPRPVELPALGPWRMRDEAPEAARDFDDSAWTVANKATSLSPIPPGTLPVLYADEYGFHTGHVWYRGQFTATGNERTVTLNATTGRNGIYQVWLNGRYLGWASGGVEADAGPPANLDAGHGDFAVPAGLVRAGERAALAVLVENMGHNDDWTAEEIRQRQPRGLTGALIDGASPAFTWRIQGDRGGDHPVDRVRGPLNNGGLFGERAGWHLPGFSDQRWQETSSLARPAPAGLRWFRTRFELSTPADQDVSIGLRIDGTGSSGVRALIFLNGWQIGHYIDGPGLQREFVLPAGILRQRGNNTLAIAVIATAPLPAGAAPVSLVVLGNHRGGVPVEDVESP
jgi:beta-galactosidase GanA